MLMIVVMPGSRSSACSNASTRFRKSISSAPPSRPASTTSSIDRDVRISRSSTSCATRTGTVRLKYLIGSVLTSMPMAYQKHSPVKPAATTRISRRRRTTKSIKRVDPRWPADSWSATGRGAILNGSTNSAPPHATKASNQVTIVPNPVTMPSIASGLSGACMKLKKPIAVVAVVSTVGSRLRVNAWCAASCWLAPARIAATKLNSTCTVSAIPTAIRIGGIDVLSGTCTSPA